MIDVIFLIACSFLYPLTCYYYTLQAYQLLSVSASCSQRFWVMLQHKVRLCAMRLSIHKSRFCQPWQMESLGMCEMTNYGQVMPRVSVLYWIEMIIKLFWLHKPFAASERKYICNFFFLLESFSFAFIYLYFLSDIPWFIHKELAMKTKTINETLANFSIPVPWDNTRFIGPGPCPRQIYIGKPSVSAHLPSSNHPNTCACGDNTDGEEEKLQ